MPTATMITMPQPPAPTDLSQFKLSSPSMPKSPERENSLSPASSPPTLTPSSMSMVSMASMLSRPPNFGFPGVPFPQGFPPKDFPRMPGDYSNLHTMMHNRPYARSPPPMVSPNDPTANDCKIVEYRGEKIAAFMINGKTMLCLPQSFELFLKNLVGGLHTVYTKCKRLEIMPMICNVEQVRVLRGLGAIQPGVNRCKLIADTDFDLLYKDCTTSRPPKRVMPFPSMSPQDAMLRLSHPMPPASEHYNNSPFGKESHGMDRGFPGPLPPHPMGAAHLMSLNNPAAQAALLSRSGVLPGMPGMPGLPGMPMPGNNPQALLESYKQSYGDMIKHLQGLQKTHDVDQDDDLEKDERDNNGSVLNLSQSQSDIHDDSVRSDSDIGEPDIATDDEMDYNDSKDNSIIKEKAEDGTKPGSVFQMMNQIQSLIKMTVEKAKQEEKHTTHQKCDLRGELEKEKESQSTIRKKIEEETKTTDLYLRRFRKEKRLRRRLQEQLENETRKIQALEAALRSLSYETLVKVKESIARDAADREKEKLENQQKDESSLNGDISDSPLTTSGHIEVPRISLSLPNITAANDAKLNYSSPLSHTPSLSHTPVSHSSPTAQNLSFSHSPTTLAHAAAQLNYNISQIDRNSSNMFPCSIPSSLPPSVSTSY